MSDKFVKRAICCITAFALMFVLSIESPHASAVEARTSYNWCERIGNFQRVNAGYTNKRPALTMIVQNFLSLVETKWARKIASAGGLDGYFGQATLDCVCEYQGRRGISVDGDVWSNTWWQIGVDLWDEDPSNGYFFFTYPYKGGYVLRALNSSPYTFYYPTFFYGDIQWNELPEYPD